MTESALGARIRQRFPNVVLEASVTPAGEEHVVIRKEGIRDLAAALKEDPEFAFSMLSDLTAVDYLFWEEKEFRFEVVYNLYSVETGRRLFVKARVSEADATIDTVTSVWASANWYEREVWDMFGIEFRGHPDPRRLLMYEGFEGHPLRKDYPYNRRQPQIGPVN